MLTNDDIKKDLLTNCVEYQRLAANEFNDRLERLAETNAFLSDKQFKLGQVIFVDEHNTFMGRVLEVPAGQYGIIIGHGLTEECGDYYRVYFAGSDGYPGICEDRIRALTEDETIPPELASYTWKWSVGKYVGNVSTVTTFK